MNEQGMTAPERCRAAGIEDVILFEAFSYDNALVGITEDGRAVYDYDKMVDWLVRTQDMNEDEAVEWIEYNTIGALPNAGDDGPIIMHALN